jgi:flagellar protein FlgJ
MGTAMDVKAVQPEIIRPVVQSTQRIEIAVKGSEPDARTRTAARKVGREFEALFTGMMLKSMRETIGKDSLTGGGHGEEVYRSLLDQEYAMAMARSGSLGLAEQIEKQLLEDDRRKAATAQRAAGVKAQAEKEE